MKGNVLWVSFLAIAVLSVAAVPAAADGSDEVFEGVIIGVPEGMTGTSGAIRGVNAAGAPWVSRGEAQLDADGRLRAEVRGLLLAGGFAIGSVTGVHASLTCEGSGVVATTAAAPLNADGDADIDEVLALPTSCVGPILLIRIAGPTGPGSWIAVSGFISTPRMRAHPFVFDPDETGIITATWEDGAGLRDGRGDATEGLVLAKDGDTGTNAAAGARLGGVRGLTLDRLGFDFLTGTHCGAGAPRYNAIIDLDGDPSTTDPTTFFFGCASGTQSNVPGAPTGTWRRVRFADEDATPADGVSVWPGFGTARVRSLTILFDEGTDVAPDFTGSVVLDNLFVNFRYVTRERGSDAPSDEPFESAIVGIPTAGSVVRGVTGGGLPWVARGEVEIEDRELDADVDGLLISEGPLAGTIGTVRGVRGSLTCAGADVVSSTDVGRLRSNGDAKIEGRIDMPALCAGPIVLIRVGATESNPGPLLGPWIAASGFEA